ncbi:uncharacterized protein Fot_33697 [Forsythia ovata]|uniref:Uncharacterized protein n=1 Tax=Forsythia ovata TaxID=205694 RepID=A0ABD1TBV9_9LAMI
MNHLEPVVASRIPGPYPFVHSSSFANSLSQSVSSWAKSNSSLGQKITTSSRSMQPSAQSQGAFGDKWNVSSQLNPGSGSDIAICNGLYHGTALGSKEPVHLPSSGFDFLKCSRGDNVASERSINLGFEKFPKGSNHVNLNGVLTKSSSNESVSLKDLNMVERIVLLKTIRRCFLGFNINQSTKMRLPKLRNLSSCSTTMVVEQLDNHGCLQARHLTTV